MRRKLYLCSKTNFVKGTKINMCNRNGEGESISFPSFTEKNIEKSNKPKHQRQRTLIKAPCDKTQNVAKLRKKIATKNQIKQGGLPRTHSNELIDEILLAVVKYTQY